jgi:nitrate reductase assembly molybdenum cofactor insertion protein NarJ
MEHNVISFPEKGKKLFETESSRYYEFSHVGWGDMETQFTGYIMGYKDAADHLVDTALASKSILILDTYIYPIIFLYRQFLELSIKSIYLKYSEDTIEKKIGTINDVSHNLHKAWNKILPILQEASETLEEKEMVEAVQDYVMQFHQFDQSSFTFRYPMDLQLNKNLNKEQRIDIKNLKLRMDELGHFFDAADAKLDHIREWKTEEQKMYAELMQDIMNDYEDYY